jgi:hypothetical protein
VTVSRASVSGLRTGHPSLSFRIRVAKGAARLRTLTVALPAGLRFVAPRFGRHGIRVSGGRVASVSLSHGRLVITLSNATGALSVKIGSDALSESSALKRKARAHKLRRLVLTVIAANATGKRTTVPVPLNHRGS